MTLKSIPHLSILILSLIFVYLVGFQNGSMMANHRSATQMEILNNQNVVAATLCYKKAMFLQSSELNYNPKTKVLTCEIK